MVYRFHSFMARNVWHLDVAFLTAAAFFFSGHAGAAFAAQVEMNKQTAVNSLLLLATSTQSLLHHVVLPRHGVTEGGSEPQHRFRA